MSVAAAVDVLVIGGTGLMGAPTARLLQAKGHRVVVVSRGAAKGGGTHGLRADQPEGCQHLICDRDGGDEGSRSDAFVAMLAAATTPRTVIDFTAMNKRHIEQVLAAHRRSPLLHYIFISTNMVYPGGPEDMDVSPLSKGGSVLIDEDAADLDSSAALLDTYGGNKLQCEKLLRDAGSLASSGADSGGSAVRGCEGERGSTIAHVPLPSTVVRPPSVVGPGCDNRHERLQRLVSAMAPLQPPAKPRKAAANPGRFRVACSGDVANVCARIVAKGPTAARPADAFNVASGGAAGVTIDEYVAAVAQVLKSRTAEAHPVRVPADPSVRNYENQGAVDTSKAEKLLGFKPSPTEAWMPETVDWHLAGRNPLRNRESAREH